MMNAFESVVLCENCLDRPCEFKKKYPKRMQGCVEGRQKEDK